MKFYSPLYKSPVEIVRARMDSDGEPIYHGKINEKEILFRASELSEMQDDFFGISTEQIKKSIAFVESFEAVLNEKKIWHLPQNPYLRIMTIEQIVKSLAFNSYATNRLRSPEIAPERWGKVYGEKTVAAFEAALQAEQEIFFDKMKKAEKISWQSINLLHTSFYNNQIIKYHE